MPIMCHVRMTPLTTSPGRKVGQILKLPYNTVSF